MSKQFQNFYKQARIKHILTSAYYLKRDGNTEIENKGLKKIQVILNKEGTNWVLKALETQMQLNNRYNSLRKVTPFFTLYGFSSRTGPTLLPEPLKPYRSLAIRYKEIAETLTNVKITKTI